MCWTSLQVILVTVLLNGSVYCQDVCDPQLICDESNLQQCLQQLTAKVQTLDNSPVTEDLSVYLDVIFSSENEKMASCCEKLCAQGGDVRIKPLSEIKPLDYTLRNQPKIKFYSTTEANIGAGDLFSTLLLDLDYAYIHWLRMDISDLEDLSTGLDVVPYLSPNVNAKFILLLLHQGEPYDGLIADFADTKDTSLKQMAPFCTTDHRCLKEGGYQPILTAYNMKVLGAVPMNVTETDYGLTRREFFLGRILTCIEYFDLSTLNCPTKPEVSCIYKPYMNEEFVNCKKPDVETTTLSMTTGGSGVNGKHPKLQITVLLMVVIFSF